ncbi:hypothetical protein OG21DRAFT_1364839, partial [Imleria badia]
IIVLTSGLPSEYDSVVVALDVVKPDELTLEITISRLLNEEERHLSHKQLEDYKTSLKGEPDSDTTFTAHTGKVNVTCFRCGKKGHFAKDCKEK